MKREPLRRLSAFILIVILMVTSVSFANDEIKKKERELEELNAKIEALDASISQNKSMQNETNQKIKNVMGSIKTLEGEIKTLNSDIEITEASIVEKTSELEAAEIKIGEKTELLNDRLRVMYKTGTIGYVEVLFGAEDFTDLLSRIDMLQKVLVHDQNLIEFLKEQRDIIETKKVELETVKVDLLDLFTSKLKKQDELTVALNNLVAYQGDLRNDAAALEEMEQQMLDRKSTRLNSSH